MRRCINEQSDMSTQISIHAPRERCDLRDTAGEVPMTISIHAPRERCDVGKFGIFTRSFLFQSTHRVSDATASAEYITRTFDISIHAPRERCDARDDMSCMKSMIFQSTHRVSDATANKKLYKFYLLLILYL